MFERVTDLAQQHWLILMVGVLFLAIVVAIGLAAGSIMGAAWAGMGLGIAFGIFIAWYSSRAERAAGKKRSGKRRR